jgi:RNA polymerase sigma factor (sigma-70 family)
MKMDDNQQDMVMRYHWLVKAVSWRAARGRPHLFDEFRDALTLALVEAAIDFREEFGIKFFTFLKYRFLAKIQDVNRCNRPMGFRCEPAGAPATKSLEAGEEAAAGEEDPREYVDAHDQIDAWLSHLPSGHRELMELVYKYGKSVREAGYILNMNWGTSHNWHNKALELIKEHIGHEDSERVA